MSKEKLTIIIGSLATIILILGAILLLGGSNGQGPSGGESVPLEALNSMVGKPAPDFTLEDYNGKSITLSSLRGKNVVLFFSEGLMCYPACWNQIAAFAGDNQFVAKNTVVLTIINDQKSDWKQAIDKMPELAPATVLFDTDKKTAIDYNTLALPSSMHKGLLPGHTYVVVDKNGIVRFVFDDPDMAVRDSQILAEIDKI